MDKNAAKPVIAWIGTGVMGQSMCRHLIEAGYQAVVYNRTAEKAEPLVKLGARWAASPKEAAGEADIIFTIVGYPSDVEETYCSEHGIFAGVKPGSIVVDMTTNTPALAEAIWRQARTLSVSALDAPVSGGDVGAREGRLSIMVGGDEKTFKTVLPLFELMGKHIVLMGGPGTGQHTKACNQIVVAGTMIGVCESLLYCHKAGLPADSLIDIISKGAASCWSLEVLGPRIAAHNFEPGFYIDHFVKDMGIALKEAAAMQLSLPGLSLVHQLYVALQGQGKGKKGTQALILALDTLSGAGFADA